MRQCFARVLTACGPAASRGADSDGVLVLTYGARGTSTVSVREGY